MKLEISIFNVQNIKKINFAVELNSNSLVCITGKNGSGKTTLIKSIKNLISADTFIKTSPSRIFSSDSEINYKIDGKTVEFKFDKIKKTIDTKNSIPNFLRRQISVELPIPYGERFNFFQRIGEVDSILRTQVVIKNYTEPTELIDFLESVYSTKKFSDLREVTIRKVPYYVIPYADNYYLREDYFSSGEFFIISLYRRITSGYMAIFIDEIDISLDAAAQVRLVEWLRKFTQIYKTTFIFTTHSLAMMRTLHTDELYYMEQNEDGDTSIERRSYSFIKSTLFGFTGWDKYILTEDDVLKDFIEHTINNYCKPSFFKHKTIYVGGGTNTTDLMKRNEKENFFSKSQGNVMVVLDGDQKLKSHSKEENVVCIPMDSVEKELLARCLTGEFWNAKEFESLIDDHARLVQFMLKTKTGKKNRWQALYYRVILKIKKTPATRRRLSVALGEPAKERDFKMAGKRLYKHLLSSKIASRKEIFDFLVMKNSADFSEFQNKIENFICFKD